MIDLIGQARSICTQMTARGVRTVLSERDLSTEGMLLVAPNITGRMGGCWDATWTAYVLVGNTGAEDELAALSGLLSLVYDLLPGGFTTADAVEIASTAGGRRAGYRIEFTTRIPVS